MNLEWLSFAIAFIALTAYMLLLRHPVKGWFHVATGLAACLAGVLWNFSLSAKEVMEVIVDALVWVDLQVRDAMIHFLQSLGVTTSSIPSMASLQSWSQSTTRPLMIATFLLGSYFVVSRIVAFFGRLIAHFVTNRLLRHYARPDAVSEPTTLRVAIEAANKRVAADAGARILEFSLLTAVVFFAVSVLLDHAPGLSPVSAGVDWTNPFSMNRYVFWLGLFVLTAELRGQLHRIGKLERGVPERPGAPAAVARPDAAAPSLLPLYRDWIKAQGAHLLFRERGSRESARAQGEPPFAGAQPLFALRTITRLLGDNTNWPIEKIEADVREHFEDFVRKDRFMIVHEPLHPVHLSVIFALCEHQQSQGRVSLVICPKHLVRYVETSFRACASQSLASLVQRGLVLDGSRGPLQSGLSFSYIIVADVDVERELLGPGEGREFLLDNLGMIAVIEAESLQTSRLKLQLPRLWRRVSRERVKVLIQVGSVENPRRLVLGLLRIEGKEEQELTWQPALAQFTSTYKFVWEGSRDMARSLLPEAQTGAGRPISAALGLAAFAAQSAEPACRDEALSPVNLSEVDAVAGRLGPDLAARVREASKADAGEKARVVIVDEYASILRTVGRFYDRYRHGEVLLNVIAHDYPLRDYHVSRLAEAKNSGAVVVDGAQIAADPRGGVREMLATLYDALRERRGHKAEDVGLLRSQIMDHLSLLPAELLNQINLIPGSEGLTHLFRQLGVDPDIRVRREEGETRYEIDGGSRDNFPQLHFSIPVMPDGKDLRFRVPAGDVGLSILPNQTVLLDGREYRIRSIHWEENSVAGRPRSWIDVFADTARMPETTIPVLEYVFTDTTWLLDKPTEGQGVPTSHYYGSFIRRTAAVIAYDEDDAPLSAPGRLRVTKLEGKDQHEQKRLYQSVWRLRFNGVPLMPDKGPAEIAFTMCVVLQDVVRALFPRWPHRINVVSPAAAGIFEKHRDPMLGLSGADTGATREAEQRKVDALLACMYPRLVAQTGSANSREPAAGTAAPAQTSAGLDIYLIEDSDFDLGVVRRLQSDPGLILGEMKKYLEWLKANGFKSRYHCFGAQSGSGILLYDRVLALIP